MVVVLYALHCLRQDVTSLNSVITSYSIHYTKLYDNRVPPSTILAPGPEGTALRLAAAAMERALAAFMP